MVLDPNQEEETARRKLHQMMDVVCVSSSAELKRRWRMELEGPLTVELYNEMMEAAMVDIRKKEARYECALKEEIKGMAAAFCFLCIRCYKYCTHAQCTVLQYIGTCWKCSGGWLIISREKVEFTVGLAGG